VCPLLKMMEEQRKTTRRVLTVASIILLILLNIFDLVPSKFSEAPRQLIRAERHAKGLHLDYVLDNHTANVYDPLKETDTAVYWHIHKASGSSVKSYYTCMGKVMVDRVGVSNGHHEDKQIAVWENEYHFRWVNVDSSTYDGLTRAKELGLGNSGLADVVVTALLPAALAVFSHSHQARVFALFRHPIDRAASLYYYRQVSSWEVGQDVYRPDLVDVSIEEFYQRKRGTQDNPILSALLNKDRVVETLTDEDLAKGKEILEQKVLIGLTNKMEASMNRFDTYFGWYDDENRPRCRNLFIDRKVNSNNSYKRVEPGSQLWNEMAVIMDYDIKLYNYAVHLWHEQRKLFYDTVDFNLVQVL